MPPDTTAIITCIEGRPYETILLRAAQNKARKHGVPWIVLCMGLPEENRENEEWMTRTLQYAEAAGATIIKANSASVLNAVTEYLGSNPSLSTAGVYLIIGELRETFMSRRRRKSLQDAFARRLPGRIRLEFVIMNHPAMPLTTPFYMPLFRISGMDALLEGVGYVLLATLASEALRLGLASTHLSLSLAGISMIYLIATAVTAIRCGLVPALVAAVIGFAAQSFFYTPPLPNLQGGNSADAANLLMFLVAAVFIAVLGNSTHTYILQSKERERFLHAMVNISGTLNRSFTRQEALQFLHGEIRTLLRLDVAYFLPGAVNARQVAHIYPPDTVLDEESAKALTHCWEEDLPTGYGTTLFSSAGWRFEVMVAASGFTGVLGVKVPNESGFADARGLMLAVLADLSASVLARIDRTQLLEESRVQEEREKLRTLLLSSVSHDLKTPLASIIGSLDIFHRLHDNLTTERRFALTQTAYQEAVRLDSFITNIIDMARLESGNAVINREWADPLLLIRRIVRRLEAKFGRRHIQMDFPAQPIEAEIDPSLFDKVISHLLDNAAKYTQEDATIHIQAAMQGERLTLTIADSGVGIPEGQEEAVFNKYTRLNKKDMQIAGTGLGLPIARAIIYAHGGTIHVGRSLQGGAMFTVELPHARLQVREEEKEVAI